MAGFIRAEAKRRAAARLSSVCNCCVQRSKRLGSDVFEIVTGSKSGVKPSPKKFKVNGESVISELSAVMKVDAIDQLKDVAVNRNVVVVGKVSSIQESVPVQAKRKTLLKQEFLLADSTGAIRGVVHDIDHRLE